MSKEMRKGRRGNKIFKEVAIRRSQFMLVNEAVTTKFREKFFANYEKNR